MITLFVVGFAVGVFGALAVLALMGWWLERQRKRRIWRIIEAEMQRRRNGARALDA